MADDEKQHSPISGPFGRRARPRALMRWIGRAGRPASASASRTEASKLLSVHDTLLALPTLLDSSSLPNGVVELLIEDFEVPIRQLFDIHDGRVTLVEPGECVPWASIAGSATAWAKALGRDRDTTALRLAGDEPLARRVLAALPKSH